MINTLSSIYDIISYTFLAWCVVLYHLSIKKCFFKENTKKIKLIVITLFTNPILLYFFAVPGVYGLIYVIFQLFDIDFYSDSVIFANTVICNTAYILVLFLSANLVGKWLKVHNRQLVMFVSLMFGIIYMLFGAEPNTATEEDSKTNIIITMFTSEIITFIASILFYIFVIKALAKLTSRERKVNAGSFIVTPTIFILFFTFAYYTLLSSTKIDNIMLLIFLMFPNMILFLFIWTFHIIINNINAMNDALEAKDLAAEMARTEALREADLNIAKNIQISALPNIFPPFPEHKEFELFASMNAAKEVGGDFYDFYMIDGDTLGFLIADVSGKSIPGAMFMMTAKSTIKNLAEYGMPPAEVFTRANEKLCEGNEAEMFVTAWLGYLDLKTGLLRVANAGHNPPVLIRGGKAEYVILKPNLMLAGMDGVRYSEQTVQLEKGDILYLYTDGVTEAMDKTEQLYGEDRLKKLLSFGENVPAPTAENGVAEPVCKSVIEDVQKFTDGAEQSDDITMLCVRYLGE